MPILTLQRRQTEVGRIRIGEKVATKGGKTRPAKLDKFRITTASRRLADQVATLYGGKVQSWDSPAGKQWEIYTDTTSLPVVVPPQDPITQWYELWSGGGCQRRCDGRTETKSGTPCLCGPEEDPEDRPCKPTTRLNVMLAEVPSIGVWRLESHGYYAAIELPGVADVLASAGGYIQGRLELQQRTSKHEKRGGGVETRQYMVPVLDVNVAPANLIALNSGSDRSAVGGGQQHAAIGSAPEAPVDWVARIAAVEGTQQLRSLWAEISHGGEMTDELTAAFKRRAAELDQPGQQQPAADTSEPVDAEIVAEQAADGPDAGMVWQQIVAEAGQRGWSTSETQRRVTAAIGVDMPDATGAQLAEFLHSLQGGAK